MADSSSDTNSQAAQQPKSKLECVDGISKALPELGARSSIPLPHLGHLDRQNDEPFQ